MDKWEIYKLIIQLHSEDWKVAQKKLTEIGKPAIPHLIDALLTYEDECCVVKECAMDILIEIGHDPLTVSKMIKALKNENSFVRYAATRILGEMGDKSAVPYLFDGFNDIENAHGGSVDIATARALGNLGDISAVTYLLAELKERDPETEMDSVNALIKLVPELIKEEKHMMALEVIKECTAVKMEYFRELEKESKNRREILKRKRDELGVLASYAQQIHDKMTQDKKKFPVKHQPVRTVRKKVIANG